MIEEEDDDDDSDAIIDGLLLVALVWKKALALNIDDATPPQHRLVTREERIIIVFCYRRINICRKKNGVLFYFMNVDVQRSTRWR